MPGDAPGGYRGYNVYATMEANMDKEKLAKIAAAFYGKHPEARPKKKAGKETGHTGRIFTHTGGRLFEY